MTTYAGISFDVELASNGDLPEWTREAFFNRRHIPYSDRDNVQYTGLGNPRLTLNGVFFAKADARAMQAAVGIAGRTLGDVPEGDGYASYTNVRLTGVKNQRVSPDGVLWKAELEFEREG